MSSSDRDTARRPGGAPEADGREPAPEEFAADVTPGRRDRRLAGRTTPPTQSTGPERRHRARRKPFVLRAPAATESAEDATVTRPLGRLVRMLQNLGPYLLIEIFLPGGTLLALLLYASRNGRPFREDAPTFATLAALGSAAGQALARWMPLDAFGLAGGGRADRDGLEPLGMVPG